MKSARLERLLDPTATGTLADETEVLASDSQVTAAVEDLLGLTFENFCQCVVLPQGEFAEFLRAKGSDRRKILMKLLGAELYQQIGREANSRAALAAERSQGARRADRRAGRRDGTVPGGRRGPRRRAAGPGATGSTRCCRG